MRQLMKMLSVAAMLAVSACGGDGVTDPDEEDDESSVTASIAGTTFTATNFNIPGPLANRFYFSASQIVGAQAHTHMLEINLDPITGKGNFLLGPTATHQIVYSEIVSGGVATRWRSTYEGATGSVDVTEFTNDRVAGTFSVTLVPEGGATGNKTATGTFNIYFN